MSFQGYADKCLLACEELTKTGMDRGNLQNLSALVVCLNDA